MSTALLILCTSIMLLPVQAAPPLLSTSSDWTFDSQQSVNGRYWIPPDPFIAVGPAHLVTTVNECIRWMSKNFTGQTSMRLGKNATISVGSFFAPLLPDENPHDPNPDYFDSKPLLSDHPTGDGGDPKRH